MSPHRARWRRSELAYCSNVHPGESLDEVMRVVREMIPAVRQTRGVPRQMAGLWLSAQAAHELAEPRRLAAFRAELDERGIALRTLNGFPVGGFHAERVKEHVYAPDWASDVRVRYTYQLAKILAACLPDDDREGTISTVPLGYRPTWTADKQAAAARNLVALAASLHQLHETCGRRVRICLEMEPGCALERSDEAVAFFRDDLASAARDAGVAASVVHAHLGLCYDVCHQAVMFERAGDALAQITGAGITVGKIQISSALRIADPADETTRAALRGFAEPRYFHQTRTRDRVGGLTGTMDLSEALDDATLPPHEWRVHFHVPVQATQLVAAGLATTQSDIVDVLDFLGAHAHLTPHLEVETYTWGVLPVALRPRDEASLIRGISAELDWLEQQLISRGLLHGRN